jgi:hypothetical protein
MLDLFRSVILAVEPLEPTAEIREVETSRVDCTAALGHRIIVRLQCDYLIYNY